MFDKIITLRFIYVNIVLGLHVSKAGTFYFIKFFGQTGIYSD